ncbi:MAG: zinc-ribbon domain-containing protein [Planctomycetes bacterium]|nr:zinc-ribbon domain-containing protein [Planctomycetota bacterium]
MYCQRCGTQISDESSFCNSCGLDVTSIGRPDAPQQEIAPDEIEQNRCRMAGNSALNWDRGIVKVAPAASADTTSSCCTCE